MTEATTNHSNRLKTLNKTLFNCAYTSKTFSLQNCQTCLHVGHTGYCSTTALNTNSKFPYPVIN